MATPDFNTDERSLSLRQRLKYSFLTITLFALVVELLLRGFYYQQYGWAPLAITESLRRLQSRDYQPTGIDQTSLRPAPAGLANTDENLFKPEYATLLKDIKSELRDTLVRLKASVQHSHATLLIVYIPVATHVDSARVAHEHLRPYFAQLADHLSIDLLDLTASFAKHSLEDLYLLPQNTHISRFGNRIIATELAHVLDTRSHIFSNRSYDGTPPICGPLEPNLDLLQLGPFHEPDRGMVYHLTTNSQGFRGAKAVDIPKVRQRVLILGGSFTLGPYLSNENTYPGLLAAMRPDLEVINSGAPGSTFIEVHELYVSRAQYVAADVVVLQVSDYDVTRQYRWHTWKQAAE